MYIHLSVCFKDLVGVASVTFLGRGRECTNFSRFWMTSSVTDYCFVRRCFPPFLVVAVLAGLSAFGVDFGFFSFAGLTTFGVDFGFFSVFFLALLFALLSSDFAVAGLGVVTNAISSAMFAVSRGFSGSFGLLFLRFDLRLAGLTSSSFLPWGDESLSLLCSGAMHSTKRATESPFAMTENSPFRTPRTRAFCTQSVDGHLKPWARLSLHSTFWILLKLDPFLSPSCAMALATCLVVMCSLRSGKRGSLGGCIIVNAAALLEQSKRHPHWLTGCSLWYSCCCRCSNSLSWSSELDPESGSSRLLIVINESDILVKRLLFDSAEPRLVDWQGQFDWLGLNGLCVREREWLEVGYTQAEQCTDYI